MYTIYGWIRCNPRSQNNNSKGLKLKFLETWILWPQTHDQLIYVLINWPYTTGICLGNVKLKCCTLATNVIFWMKEIPRSVIENIIMIVWQCTTDWWFLSFFSNTWIGFQAIPRWKRFLAFMFLFTDITLGSWIK